MYTEIHQSGTQSFYTSLIIISQVTTFHNNLLKTTVFSLRLVKAVLSPFPVQVRFIDNSLERSTLFIRYTLSSKVAPPWTFNWLNWNKNNFKSTKLMFWKLLTGNIPMDTVLITLNKIAYFRVEQKSKCWDFILP